MNDFSIFHGPNAAYVRELYAQYRQNPSSVDGDWRAFFERVPPEALNAPALPSPPPAAAAAPYSEEAIRRVVGAARLAQFIREHGHLAASLDPLGLTPPPGDPELLPDAHGIAEHELALMPASVVGGPLAIGAASAREAIGRLRGVYSGVVGYETDHVQSADEREWLYEAIESGRFYAGFDAALKRDLLQRLTEVDTFERYIHSTFQGAKRFSIEGCDMLVPVLDEITLAAARSGSQEVILGMAHRGRLNVLAHVLGKPYSAILTEFSDASHDPRSVSVAGKGSPGWSGDVKYHLGARRLYKQGGVREMPIMLVPNPSHLEFVNAVAEGHARAAQENRKNPGTPVRDEHGALCVLIHGDAAFPGQGIVAETLNLSNLKGYGTGGTIHIIANNQIGFTTLPGDSRSTLYAADLAKGFEIPIVHVNADEPLACVAIARMAFAYREKFGKDFLIDLVGYRRYGHNENDEPRFTQPRIYQAVDEHPRIRDKWEQELAAEGILSESAAADMVTAVHERLRAARETPYASTAEEGDAAPPSPFQAVTTAVPDETLRSLNTALYNLPDGFRPLRTLDTRVIAKRRDGLDKEGGIEWGHAETLAYASLLAEGTPIRLTGQDSERGTFNQRQAVVHDTVSGTRWCALNELPGAKASFAVYNSPLSENACVGFEYGYSVHAPETLVLWEGQFGDFANGAQVIIDQFVISGRAKWREKSGLVLLLPHGYEGQGPEHSSARLERFLQLAAQDNIRVANCSTAAQYFHLLRRQAKLLATDPRPLVIMTPKSLLRLPDASSSLADLTQGAFQLVIDDPRMGEAPGKNGTGEKRAQVTRLVLCSGKVYYDLIKNKEFAGAERVAVARVEQLYPFPADEVRAVIAGYPNLQEIGWLQEEPANMGAWTFVAPRLKDQEIVGWGKPLHYFGRYESASPAEGSGSRHAAWQSRILANALSDTPEPAKKTKVGSRS